MSKAKSEIIVWFVIYMKVKSEKERNTVRSEAIVMILGPFLKVVTPISFNDSTIWA